MDNKFEEFSTREISEHFYQHLRWADKVYVGTSTLSIALTIILGVLWIGNNQLAQQLLQQKDEVLTVTKTHEVIKYVPTRS